MAWLDSLISSGHIVDVMLAVVLVEVLLLLGWWYWRQTGVPPRALLVNAGAGGSLMLALRAVLIEQGTLMIALWLIASLLFHLADLLARWRHRPH